VTTALYRRYRPERFEDVIGQEHVTGPLMAALDHDRVSHAYLFSGPRGCGKTTSARILARCLNCERGVSSTPCGECDSCRALARDGAGSLDVVEIDAASHGGVDDARDLRERAFFAPASSRYKIYIIDEAHMVSREGFNALLKIVEEPPPHLKFVFATTAPDKVLGTIRSRTHHYPFRLVPPRTLQAYLERICSAEGVTVEPAVLPLVVRAGGGSVRDSLSVLDQLIAGSAEEGVTYGEALGLLGYTDAALLDEVVDAFAAHDGASVFEIVDRVIEAGHDPRRFVEDLLERMRDLIVLSAAPDAAGSILSHLPADQLDRMAAQAHRFGAVELSRAADLINTGLTEMRGATAPRLQLELICARVLLPRAAVDPASIQTRVERLERRIDMPARPLVAPAAPSTPASLAPADTAPDRPEPSARPVPSSPQSPPELRPGPAGPPPQAAAQPPPPAAAQASPQAAAQPPAAAQAGPGSTEGLLVMVRRRWPEVLEAVKRLKRLTWTLLVHNGSVLSVDDGTLVLGLVNAGARDSFTRTGSPEIVRQALIDVLEVDWQVEAVVDPAVEPPGSGAPVPPASPVPPAPPGPGVARTVPGPTDPGGSARGAPDRGAGGATDTADGEGGPARRPSPAGRRRSAPPPVPASPPEGDEGVAADDPDMDVSATALLARELGASVVAEYDEPA
jgi:DNA polymerase-3 subunit gamma/tau